MPQMDALHRRPNRRAAFAVALALFCSLVASAALVWPRPADSAPLRVLVLGAKNANVPADCPETERKSCKAEGRVTGFQSLSTNTRNLPYEVPTVGKIVSWTITLSRPSTTDRGDADDEVFFFNEFFGTPAKARISVLRKVPRSSPPRYRLVRQSAVQTLNPYFGSTPEFALARPLPVFPGQIVGITIPTWAPAFFHSAACDEIAPEVVRDPGRCVEFAEENTWRGSRTNGECTFDTSNREKFEEDLGRSHAQTKVDSRREYGCYYQGARLLYTVTMVKKPGQ